ncbi:MAG: SpoIIIAH-like family protein [bacterium]
MYWRRSSVTIWLLVCVGVLLTSALYLHSRQVTNNAPLSQPESVGERESLSEPSTPGDSFPETSRQDFYAEQRLDRDRMRSQKVDTLREIIHNPDTHEENRKEANAQLLQITEEIALEGEIEALIKAKSFPDAIVYLHPDSIHVLVKIPEITEAQAAQIGDIVAKSTGLALEKIVIDTKP